MTDSATHHGILSEGRNCWRIAKADKAAFLIDGDAYFRAFVSAVENAERSVYIAGWDLDSRTALLRENEAQREEYDMGRFLDRMAAEKPGLHIYCLPWDFSMIFALDRELFPIFKLGMMTHERVHFHMDSRHPVGASHHQKIVVVDDSIAFVGGLDLTKGRWDSPKHSPDDARRVDPQGHAYQPFHDVQMAVGGEAAQAVGDLFRKRWRAAADEELKTVGHATHDAWPHNLEADLKDVSVGISRTEPTYGDSPEVREIEALYLDAIKAAREYVYIENQYLTNGTIKDALVERLAEEAGPEIAVVTSQHATGWLEESVMDTSRAIIIKELREADRFGHFQIWYPVIPGEQDQLKVHSKIIVADDDFASVGSANLSNRSMGFDTECNLSIEAQGSSRIRENILRFRNRLVSEHLGIEEDTLSDSLSKTGSLLESIERLRGSGRTLEPLQVEAPAWLKDIPISVNPGDPERPMDPERLIYHFVPKHTKRVFRSDYIGLGAVLAMLVLFAAFWRWGPLGEWLSPQAIADMGASVEPGPETVFIVIAAFVIGTLCMAPVTLLVVATSLMFQPWHSILYSTAGAMVSGIAMFAAGHYLGHKPVRRIVGEKVNRISKRLAKKGILSVAVLQTVPLSHFPILNLVMGASHVKFRDFLLGTAIAIIPQIMVVTLIGKSLMEVIQQPKTGHIVLLVVVLLLAGGATAVISFVFNRREAAKQTEV